MATLFFTLQNLTPSNNLYRCFQNDNYLIYIDIHKSLVHLGHFLPLHFTCLYSVHTLYQSFRVSHDLKQANGKCKQPLCYTEHDNDIYQTGMHLSEVSFLAVEDVYKATTYNNQEGMFIPTVSLCTLKPLSSSFWTSREYTIT